MLEVGRFSVNQKAVKLTVEIPPEMKRRSPDKFQSGTAQTSTPWEAFVGFNTHDRFALGWTNVENKGDSPTIPPVVRRQSVPFPSAEPSTLRKSSIDASSE